jgi:hypothetical protein
VPTFVRLLIIAAALMVVTPRSATAQSDREQVMMTINEFLRGLRTKDSTLMMQHMDSLTRLTLLRPGQNGAGTRVLVLSGMDFIRNVTRPNQPALDEPIRNPVIHIDGDLATVWAEYQVIVNDQVSHCGYDAFHLARLDGRWKILNVSDTFRRTGCGERWNVPRD